MQCSGLNDGASVVLMMSEDMANSLGYKPMARWLGSAEHGVDPRVMENLPGGTMDMSRWNPNGGANAFGHPNGASGTRIASFAMHHLQDIKGKYGLFSSCCGSGQGVSTLIVRV